MNDYTAIAPALLGGARWATFPVVQPKLARLFVRVISEWHFPYFDLSLYPLGNRHMSKAVRVFQEFASQMARTFFPSLPA